MKSVHLPSVVQDPTKDEAVAALWRQYLQKKTCMKTASLLSRAMECCMTLGGVTAGEPLALRGRLVWRMFRNGAPSACCVTVRLRMDAHFAYGSVLSCPDHR